MLLSPKLSGWLCVALCGWVGMAAAEEPQAPRGAATAGLVAPPRPPAVGRAAPKLELKDVGGVTFSLQTVVREHPVVVVVLRGWPGYQCPACSRQVGDFLERREAFRELGAEVVFVYPGPADLLKEHAQEFQGTKEFPPHFHFVLDPDYTAITAWGLRWDAPRETAYPSTFVVGRDGLIHYGETSTTHGGRLAAAAALDQLAKLKSAAQQ